MALIYQTKKSHDCYEVFFENGVKIGEFIQDVDGFFKFFPELRGGYWRSYVLREVADAEDAHNEEWNKQIEDYFKEPKDKE